MKKVILVRCGEIMLKGLNRPIFESKLIENIKISLAALGKIKVRKSQARIFIEPEDDGYNFDEAVSILTRVFGIVSVSIVLKIPSDWEEIKRHSLELAKKHMRQVLKEKAVARSHRNADKDNIQDTVWFKVEAKRGDKSFPMKSPEICSELGGYLLGNIPGLKVDVHEPDFVFYVEVRKSAYIYCEIVPAAGGLPVGTNGKAVLLLSGGIDSPVAGWMMAKRGMEIEAVHFHSYPYTSERARDKVIELAKILSRYCLSIKLHIVPFTDIQLEINEKCPEDHLTLIMRRVMMKIAERIALNSGAHALTTGESLGQVASQTVQSLAVTNAAVRLPVFRPLIGMDKNDVVEIARKIGTFETSILPYEDCCTLFVAKHPKLKPRLDETERYENRLKLEPMIENALNNTEILVVSV
ncbi:MAG: tRNA uracil 4-sulfurtransferase ThiI [Acetivibrionales bacterium]|jgi:thiamine biosynthesis protein ThiI